MKNTLWILFVFILTGTQAQNYNFNIVFKPGETVLGEPQKKSLRDAAFNLRDGANVTFLPLAYDSVYDLFRFTSNAKEQANAIAEYASGIGFQLKGIPRNFPSSYSGLSVGVFMKYSKTTLVQDTVVVPIAGKPQGLQGYYPPKASQFFVIDPKRDTLIIGNEGTKLLFKAGSLLSQKKVKIELKEFYKLEDYMKNGLPTASNGRMIQTGGSIYLDAREDNAQKKQVQINQQMGVDVDFTLGKNDTAMKVFIKDPKSPDQLNWILPRQRRTAESWQMTEIVYGPTGQILSERKFNSKEEFEQYQKDKENLKKQSLEQAAIKQTTIQEMESKLKIYDLGYINCDKFYGDPMMPLILIGDEKYNAEYYLVYTDIRGVMKAETDGNMVQFRSAPKGRTAILIAVCFIAKQAYYFKTLIGKDGAPGSRIKLEAVDDTYLNQELSLLR